MYRRKHFYALWAGLFSALLAAVFIACTQSSVNPPVQPIIKAADTTHITNGIVLNGCGFIQDTCIYFQVEAIEKHPYDPSHVELAFGMIPNGGDSSLNTMILDMTIPADTGSYQWQDWALPYQQPDPSKVICYINLYDMLQPQLPPQVYNGCEGLTYISKFNKISNDSVTINGTISGDFLDDNGDTLKLTSGVFNLNFH